MERLITKVKSYPAIFKLGLDIFTEDAYVGLTTEEVRISIDGQFIDYQINAGYVYPTVPNGAYTNLNTSAPNHLIGPFIYSVYSIVEKGNVFAILFRATKGENLTLQLATFTSMTVVNHDNMTIPNSHEYEIISADITYDDSGNIVVSLSRENGLDAIVYSVSPLTQVNTYRIGNRQRTLSMDEVDSIQCDMLLPDAGFYIPMIPSDDKRINRVESLLSTYVTLDGIYGGITIGDMAKHTYAIDLRSDEKDRIRYNASSTVKDRYIKLRAKRYPIVQAVKISNVDAMHTILEFGSRSVEAKSSLNNNPTISTIVFNTDHRSNSRNVVIEGSKIKNMEVIKDQSTLLSTPQSLIYIDSNIMVSPSFNDGLFDVYDVTTGKILATVATTDPTKIRLE